MVKKYSAFMGKNLFSFRVKHLAKSCAFVLGMILVMCGKTSMAAAPQFARHVVDTTVCNDGGVVDLASLLSFSDPDATGNVTFTVVSGPAATGSITPPYGVGSLSGFPYTMANSVATTSPAVNQVKYSFLAANHGIVSFTIKVADAASEFDQMTINIRMVFAPVPTITSNYTAVHIGSSITLTGYSNIDTGRTGTNITSSWLTTTPSLLSVTNGVVTGNATGNGSVTFRQSNACGNRDATYPVNVITNIPPQVTSITGGSSFIPGSTIQLNGSFTAPYTNYLVHFGATLGTVNAGSSTASSLSVTVPSGATYGPIHILDTTSQLSALVSPSFIPRHDSTGFIQTTVKDIYNKTLISAPVTSTDTSSPYSIEYADLNGDGKSEMIVSGTGLASIIVYPNISTYGKVDNSSFGSPLQFRVAASPISTRVADLDGDGNLDIACVAAGAAQVSVLRNTTSTIGGTITFATRFDIALPGALPSELAIADLNKDGRLDIAVAMVGASDTNAYDHAIGFVPTEEQKIGRLVVIKNNYNRGPGVVMNASSFDVTNAFSYTATDAPLSLAAADLNADGFADVAVSVHHSRKIDVFRNTSTAGGNIQFAAPTAVSTSIGSGTTAADGSNGWDISSHLSGYPEQIKIGDLDGDGKPDLAVAVSDSDLRGGNLYNAVAIIPNQSAAASSLSFGSTITISSGGKAPVALSLGDLTGDGRLDIVASNSGNATLGIISHSASNSFTFDPTTTVSLVLTINPPTQAVTVAIGDVDGNGIYDLAVADRGGRRVQLLRGYPRPDTTSITGDSVICLATTPGTITGHLHSNHSSASTATGTWSIPHPASPQHVDFVGVTNDTVVNLTGLSAGVDTVYYTVVQLGDTNRVKYVVRVLGTSSAGTITIQGGGDSVCLNGTAQFVSSAPGGTWSSVNPSVISINASTGVATGQSSGSTTISYSVGSCPVSSSMAVRVPTLPTPGTLQTTTGVSGSAAVCPGQTITLYNIGTSIHNGTWTSAHGLVTLTPFGNTDSVTVVASSSALSTDVDTVKYTIHNDCATVSTTFRITFNNSFTTPVITPDNDSLCQGSSINVNVTSGTTGGTWTVSAPTVATVTSPTGSAAVINGLSAGTVNVTYSVSNVCGSATTLTALTVSPQLQTGVTISGPTRVCVGSNISLTPSPAAIPGIAYTWSVSNSAASTVSNTGVVHGMAPGYNVISYTQSNICGTNSSTYNDTVSNPTVGGSITASSSSPICLGNQDNFSNATAQNGVITWSSSNTAVATIDPNTGVATSTGAGTTVITSTNIGCDQSTATYNLTVDGSGTIGTISGPVRICSGGSISLTYSGGTVTGTSASWTATPGVSLSGATASGVTVNANTTSSQINDTITYTVNTGCGPLHTTYVDTIMPVPSAGTITGNGGTYDSLCASVGTVTLLNTTSSPATGTWSSLNNAVAVVSTSGTVTAGSTADTTTIVYTVSNAACGSRSTGRVVKVKPQPFAGSLSASPATICAGPLNSSTLTTTGNPGGFWRPVNTASESVTINSASGTTANVSGAATTNAGANPLHSVTINYVDSNYCGVATSSVILNINTVPVATAITTTAPADPGLDSLCVNTATTTNLEIRETVAPASASVVTAWSLSNNKLSFITPTTSTPARFASGSVAGLDTISVIISNVCGSDTSTRVIRILPPPDAGTIIAPSVICYPSAPIQLYDTLANGDTAQNSEVVWSNIGTSIFVDENGILYTNNTGNATITLETAFGFCGTSTTQRSITVVGAPIAGVITGDTTVCVNAQTTLIDNPGVGDYWYSSDTTIAKVNALTGVVTGISAGFTTINYVDTNACGSASQSQPMHVNGLSPVGFIYGQDTSCINGSVQLFDDVTGGSWSSSNTSIASINATTGLVTAGTIGGQVTITYATSNGCGPNDTTMTFRVFAAPNFSSATTANVCDSALFQYVATSDTANATWSWTRAVVPNIANLAASGADTISEYLDNTGNAVTNAVYVYTVTAHGCQATQNVTVAVAPTPHLTSPLADTICSGALFNYIDVESTGPTTVATWTRPVVTFITPATVGNGVHNINETLTNTNPANTPVVVTYIYTLNWPGCPTHTENVTVLVDPSAGAPKITTHSPSEVCTRTLDQNFGAETVPGPGITYTWVATGAQVWATGNTRQYSLVNFTEPGNAVVYLLATISGYDCPAKDSFPVTVTSSVSDLPEVIYFNGDFVCTANDQDTYQWGYDDRGTLDSALFNGETNQNFYVPTPDFTNKYYFVITTHNGCMQKSYFMAPTGVQNVTASMGEMKLYPNPADNFVNVEINNTSGGKYTIEVVDLLGQKIDMKDMINNKTTVQVADLSAGVYFVNCYRDGVKFASAKFVKN